MTTCKKNTLLPPLRHYSEVIFPNNNLGKDFGRDDSLTKEDKSYSPYNELSTKQQNVKGVYNEMFRPSRARRFKKKKIDNYVTRVKRAPGGNDMPVGPELIVNNTEVTPASLLNKKNLLSSFSLSLHQPSFDMISLTPFIGDNYSISQGEGGGGVGEKRFHAWMQSQSQIESMTWNLNLEGLEEATGKTESYEEKIGSNLPPQAEIEDVYVIKSVNINQPDGKTIPKDLIRVLLTETPIEFTIQIQGNFVLQNTEEAAETFKRNENYKKVVKLHEESDIFVDRESQTFGESEREIGTQYRSPNFILDAQTQVKWHEIFDEFEKVKVEEEKQKAKNAEDQLMRSLVEKEQEDQTDKFIEKSSPSSSENELDNEDFKSDIDINWNVYEEESEDEKNQPNFLKEELVYPSSEEEEFDTMINLEDVYVRKETNLITKWSKTFPDISNTVMSIERMISMNAHQDKQAEMRGFELTLFNNEVDEKGDSIYKSNYYSSRQGKINLGPSLVPYWYFKTNFTKGKAINSLITHPKNGNLIAAVYGSFEFGNEEEGCVCIWNAKNIEYPERVYNFNCSVTAVAFARKIPYLMAVGLFDGNIVIYDIRKTKSQIVSSTFGLSSEKHVGPVWDLYWTSEAETGRIHEMLISLGDDGIIYKWSTAKKFESFVMMKLRRSPLKIPGRRENRAESLISQYSAAFTFCFYPEDTTQYLVGTEEGFIHKCTMAYQDQYVNTYIGHTGPVYRISFSPYDKSLFISCGGDWTVKIWKENLQTPILSLNTGLRTIFDVTCCPFMSTVFIVANELQIEVWDLESNTLEPIVEYKQEVGLRRAIFSNYLKSVLIADNDGGIIIYGLRNFPQQPETFEGQVDKLYDNLGLKKAPIKSKAQFDLPTDNNNNDDNKAITPENPKSSAKMSQKRKSKSKTSVKSISSSSKSRFPRISNKSPGSGDNKSSNMKSKRQSKSKN